MRHAGAAAPVGSTSSWAQPPPCGCSRSRGRCTSRSARTPIRRHAATCRCPGALTLDNYVRAWHDADLPRYFVNTVVVVVPAGPCVLLLGAMVAFAVSRFSWRWNVATLLVLTAGNLLPPQVVVDAALPALPRAAAAGAAERQRRRLRPAGRARPGPRRLPGRLLRLRPERLDEDPATRPVRCGAGWMAPRSRRLPVDRAAALAPAARRARRARSTWIYNDFFWAATLIRTRRPATDHGRPAEPGRRVLHRIRTCSPPGRCSWRSRRWSCFSYSSGNSWRADGRRLEGLTVRPAGGRAVSGSASRCRRSAPRR